MYKHIQTCTNNQIQIIMKVAKHLTLEKKTVEIIKELAAKDKRKENSVVDLAVQAYYSARQDLVQKIKIAE